MFRPDEFLGIKTYNLCQHCPIECFNGIECLCDNSKFLGTEPSQHVICGFLDDAYLDFKKKSLEAYNKLEAGYEDNLKTGDLFLNVHELL